MIYFRLFFSFMKIGFTSFGGMSMIPLILEEMQKNHWMTAEDMSNLVAIAEMTPGPLGLNCATFAGEHAAGIFGGITAVTGVLMPAFTLTLLVAIFFNKFKENQIMSEVLGIVKPICIAMIIATILELGKDNYLVKNKMDWYACGIGILMFYLIVKKKWSVPRVIVTSAVLGVFCYQIMPGI